MNTVSSIFSEGIRHFNVHKMMKHFEKFSFIKCTRGRMTLGFNGENIKQTIHNEWLISNTIMCDEPSLLSAHLKMSELKSAFISVDSFFKTSPCSIISSCRINVNKEKSKEDFSSENDTINSCFNQNDGLLLQKYLICEANCADNFFNKLQRDRLKWWKKFSASPGQFSLSPTFNTDEGQYVEIHVNFPWGDVVVEKINFLPEFIKKAKDSPYHVLAAEVLLEKMVLTMLCDGYESSAETGMEVLRFHRKLAPYKVALAGINTKPENEQDMKDLALLLAKQMRRDCNSVLLLSDICSTPLEDQIIRNDSLGIPYTVILTEKTLNTGLLEIRSRDTTLKEQSHVGSLAPYVVKLMKNY